MYTYLSALGWWNFMGSLVLLGFFNESFARIILNQSKIFVRPVVIDYWTKFWIFWAFGLNVFYGLVNILAARWDYFPLTRFVVIADLIAYLIFTCLSVWGYFTKNCGNGIFSVLLVFMIWIVWGIVSCFQGGIF